jgi:hypothetical protein
MPNRTAKFASAVFASVLAGANFTGVSSDTARADDSCLTAPKGTAPAGSHWYYRIEHATQRHCWYVRDEKDKQARAAPQDTAAATDTASAPDDTPSVRDNAGVSKSVADAHAELQPPQAPAQQPANALANQRPAAIGVDPAAAANIPPANRSDASVQHSIVAQRWIGSSSAAADNSTEATPPSTSDATSQPDDPAPAPSPVATAVPLAAADAPSMLQSNPIQAMLMIIIGALAFAGLAGSIIFRFGRSPSPAMQDRRQAIWDTAFDELPQRPVLPASAVRRPNIGIPRELQDELRNALRDDTPDRLHHQPRDDWRAVEDPNDRIVEMLARLAKSAPS